MQLDEALATIALQTGQIAVLEAQVAERDATIYEMKLDAARMKFELERFRRKIFGDSSEKLRDNELVLPGISLAIADPLDPDASARKPPIKVGAHERSRDRKPSRGALVVLARAATERVVDYFPEGSECRCCGAALVSIGFESKIEVDYVPARYQRSEHRRHKMACSQCKKNGVQIASPIESVVPGAGPIGLSLCVHIAVAHFNDHLPFHRLAGIFNREGLLIDRSTLSRTAMRVASALSPLIKAMEQQLLGSKAVLGIDGTGLKIFDKSRCLRRSVYVLHGEGHVIFRPLRRQSADHVLQGLQLFRGVMLSDAAKVFTGTARRKLLIAIALCNAHARRNFYDARDTDKERTDVALKFYAQVARHEQRFSTLDVDERRAERQRVLAPLFEQFYRWLTEQIARVHPRSPMASAISYAITHHEGLTRFLSDGRIPWTNNESERHLRHIVVGRKNWVYRGTFAGAEAACVLWSVMMSCRIHHIDPEAYLCEVLRAMQTVPHSKLLEWTPAAWALRQPRASATS